MGGKSRFTKREGAELKKHLILSLCLLSLSFMYSDEIELPELNLNLIDNKTFNIEILNDQAAFPVLKYSILPRPSFSEEIKLDLEKILPDKSETVESQKPVNAQLNLGYGLNNELLVSFALFLSDMNPKISLNYIRKTYERNRIDRPDDTSSASSIDHVSVGLISNYKQFSVFGKLDFFNKNYGLQGLSAAYNEQTKRLINLDISPSFKFNNRNELTYKLETDIIMIENSPNESFKSLNQFTVFVRNDFLFTQVFTDNQVLQATLGYNFNYMNNSENDRNYYFYGNISDIFYNEIKTTLSYQTIIKDAFLIQGLLDIRFLFRDTTFHWYINPFVKLEYNLHEYFSCSVEGGSLINERPDENFILKNDYSLLSTKVLPGYRWFADTGLTASVLEWFKITTNFEYAFNMSGTNLTIIDPNQRLVSHINREFHELNINAGLFFTVKGILNIKASWEHRFLEVPAYTGRDRLSAEIRCTFSNVGIDFFVDGKFDFVVRDYAGILMGNKYEVGTGFDFSKNEAFAIGFKFSNIAFQQEQRTIAGYFDRGINGIIYIKIGF